MVSVLLVFFILLSLVGAREKNLDAPSMEDLRQGIDTEQPEAAPSAADVNEDQSTSPLQKHIELINHSNKPVWIEWINPETGSGLPFGRAAVGHTFSLDSYVNHTFVLQDGTTVKYVTVPENAGDHTFVVHDGLVLTSRHEEGVLIESIKNCRKAAQSSLEHGKPINMVLETLETCLIDQAVDVMEESNENLSFERQIRQRISFLTEDYTCADSQRQTSEPIRMEAWEYVGNNYSVGILHDHRARSKIHLIENFISQDACEAIQALAQPQLHRGTVADGKGGSRLSDSRKAWQAGIRVPESGPIAEIQKKIFAYANHATGFGMDLPGQEDLMSIQYFGSGEEKPDRYMPHCDGDCNLLPHKRGGRVATMVMYCDTTDLVGGGTNFQHANVFVKATLGAAAFFSYLDPESHIHEEGFTMHSGCPVLNGTKRIAVQWMRIGVDEENPWDSFDTNTISRYVYDDDDNDKDDKEEEDDR